MSLKSEAGKFEALLCEDNGLLYETCKLPHDVNYDECAFVPDPRANGFFDHEDPNECGKFYSCNKGVASPLRSHLQE